ncbi:glycosyltransferase involved in cell wall biosynthesis [Kineosphaera limosa]|nr:glycosyltransferase family 2 protein [Kineosphaera limosa]NYE02198.1 glycosyltransferase involved in cell wall biosynthesis [Kineosphaera limosa]
MHTSTRNTVNPRVTIVIPVLNEARNLELVIPQLPPVHEIVVVDGRSSDDTVETARRLAPEATIITQSRRGKGNALCAGFEAATGDIVVMFDADCSADPAEIPAFVEALKAGADFAKGSRNAPGGGSEDITVIRGLGNKGLNLLSNVLIRSRYTDLCYGYNAFWTDILPALRLPEANAATDEPVWGDGFEIETLLTCRVAAADLAVTEVPSIERQRVHGVSNLNAVSDGLRVLRTILVEKAMEKRTQAEPLPAAPSQACVAERDQLDADRRAARDHRGRARRGDRRHASELEGTSTH